LVIPEVPGLKGRALLSTTSAVAWLTGRGVTHTALYAINKTHQVEVSVDGGKFTNLWGYAKQISAGLDVFNNPEVYAIGVANGVWLNKGSGWVSLGGYVKQISASIENTIYAIGGDNAVYENSSGGWVELGGYFKQISTGLNVTSGPEVFAIGLDDALDVNHASGFFTKLGPNYVTEISAPAVVAGFSGDLTYAVSRTHQALLHNGSFSVIGGGTVE
jgi:hypothetical protein